MSSCHIILSVQHIKNKKQNQTHTPGAYPQFYRISPHVVRYIVQCLQHITDVRD